MKEKIIELIILNRTKFWDEQSETPAIPLTENEEKLVAEGDNQLAEDIINLIEI